MSIAKWNARTVIRRALIVAETLLQGEEPRFKLDGDIPYYDKMKNSKKRVGSVYRAHFFCVRIFFIIKVASLLGKILSIKSKGFLLIA